MGPLFRVFLGLMSKGLGSVVSIVVGETLLIEVLMRIVVSVPIPKPAVR